MIKDTLELMDKRFIAFTCTASSLVLLEELGPPLVRQP